LHFGLNSLTRTIPPEIQFMTHLQQLFLTSNSFSGELPSQVGALSDLALLALGENLLTGQLPTELGLLANLTCLDLETNFHDGPIPSEFGLLGVLQRLFMGHSGASGRLPTEFGLLGNLNVLCAPCKKPRVSATLKVKICLAGWALIAALTSADATVHVRRSPTPQRSMWLREILAKASSFSLQQNAFSRSIPARSDRKQWRNHFSML